MKARRHSSRIAWALSYAEQGFPVFPCQPGSKKPLTPHGFKEATTDPKQIQQWWTQWLDANIGIPTGSRSGLIALDEDPRNGGDESLTALLAGRKIPKTAKQWTGGGGQHFSFGTPATFDVGRWHPDLM